MSLSALMQRVSVTRSVWVLVPFLGVLPLVAPASAATTISGTVWLDLDGDGIQDGGAEVGQSGVEVAIYAVGETDPTATDTTDGSGNYSFSLPDTGSCYIRVTAPGGYEFSAMNQGADDNVDSDVDGDGESDVFPVDGTNATDKDLDAGLIEPTSVSGFVWDDLDGDGIQDAGETGISGVDIQLRDADSGDALVASTTTGGDGLYQISNLVPLANGFLQIVLPAGHVLSAQDAGSDDTLDSDFDPATDKTANFAINYSDEIEDMDAGLYEEVTVSGQVWDDEDGDGVLDGGEGGLSANATVKLYDAGADEAIGGGDDTEEGSVDTQTTYSFTGVSPGTYYVEVTAPAGWDFSRQDQGGDDDADSDVDEDSGQTPVFPVESGDDDVVRDAGLAQFGSISGLVWKDADNDGVQDGGETGQEDVSVALYQADDGEFVKATTTAADGTYEITKAVADDYYVRFSAPTGYAFGPQDQGGDDTADSDADPNDGQTADFTVAASTAVENVDAGLQVDTDSDGTADHEDDCPNDAEKTSAGECGCGEPDTDSDDDGIADCNDNCPDDENATQRDYDGDGVGDACDNCPSVTNADQADADEDGIGDVCEVEDETPVTSSDDDATTDDDEEEAEDEEAAEGEEEEEGADETTEDELPLLQRLLCGPFGLFLFAFTIVGYGTFVAWWRRRR